MELIHIICARVTPLSRQLGGALSENSWRFLNCSCAPVFNDNFSHFFFPPRMLCVVTPVFSQHVISRLCGALPASVDARAVWRGLRKRECEKPPPCTHSCIMHAYICSASCVVSCSFSFSFFPHSPLSAISPRLRWRCRRWAGRRSTPWISTPVRV